MKSPIVLVVLALILGLALGGCRSLSLPTQIPATMKAACDLYTTAKPDVIKAREYAKQHWSQIPEDVKPILKQLDTYLPELDKAGQTICAASTSLEHFDGKTKVNWDDVLSTVIRAVGFAVELKQRGAI